MNRDEVKFAYFAELKSIIRWWITWKSNLYHPEDRNKWRLIQCQYAHSMAIKEEMIGSEAKWLVIWAHNFSLLNGAPQIFYFLPLTLKQRTLDVNMVRNKAVSYDVIIVMLILCIKTINFTKEKIQFFKIFPK